MIFLLSDKTSWPLQYVDASPPFDVKESINIKKLRDDPDKIHTKSIINNKDDLATYVLAAVNAQLSNLDFSNDPIFLSLPEIPVEFEGEVNIFVRKEEYIDKIIKEILYYMDRESLLLDLVVLERHNWQLRQ